ncbi:hypothetical protein NE237_007746 [Protea cynaroides]|uniref:Uncharacterized protein n=1 Tax=Protea cynaroides TaxID=273540 RepID=A0A9Q0KPR9_9MAGN|nr:hypothetical protein NE237_007746 [Protea cynaroides]
MYGQLLKWLGGLPFCNSKVVTRPELIRLFYCNLRVEVALGDYDSVRDLGIINRLKRVDISFNIEQLAGLLDLSDDFSFDETVSSNFDWIAIGKMRLQVVVLSDEELKAIPPPRGTTAARAGTAVDARERHEDPVEMETKVPPTTGGGFDADPPMPLLRLTP